MLEDLWRGFGGSKPALSIRGLAPVMTCWSPRTRLPCVQPSCPRTRSDLLPLSEAHRHVSSKIEAPSLMRRW